MRIFIFSILLFLVACNSDSASKNEASSTSQKTESKDTSAGSKYKKTAKNSEFAVYKTISASETHTTYYFKTLDGISFDFKVSIEGEPEVKVPHNLLEHAKYLEGHPGANPEMAGKVFEIIYDKDNYVGEVKLAELE